MEDWLGQTPALVASIAVVFGPGLFVLAAIGIRGLGLWALAPAISTTALTGSALVTGLLGIPWRPLPAALSILVLAGVALAFRQGFGLPAAPARAPDRLRGILTTGVLIGIAFTGVRLGMYIGEPAAISQTNDAAFHLSALRFALDAGAASPLEISGVIGATSFYPSGWHVLTVLVPQLTGASVEVAANTVSLVLAAVAWPLGVAYLARSAAGTLAGSVAAALAGFITAFPLLLIQWGILYPQLLAVAVLPAAVAVVVAAAALRSGHPAEAEAPADADRRTRTACAIRVIVVIAAAAGAIAVAQPSVLLAWAAASLAFGVSAAILGRATMARRVRVLAWSALLAGVLLTAAAWWFFSRSVSVRWPPTAGKAEALVEILANAHLGYPPSILVSALALIGLGVAVASPRLRWLGAVWLVFSGLYFTTAAIGSPVLRSWLVGAWYEDPYRLAALTPVATLPLAGIGGAWLVSLAVRGVRTASGVRGAQPGRRAGGVAMALIGVVGAVALVIVPQIDRRDVFADRIDPNLYAVSADSFLSADELAILERLDDLVPEDAVVVGNPSTGAAFGYALSGRDVIPRSWAAPSNAAYSVLWTSLRDAGTNPQVCAALDTLGATYVLDFGPGEVYPGRWVMPGFTNIDGQPGFELVAREGAASLYEVTACG